MSCPACFSGHAHDGQPLGKVEKIDGRATYVAESKQGGSSARETIIIIPDAFGWEFVNNRLLADHYAAKGNFRVLLPDFMDGAYLGYFTLTDTGTHDPKRQSVSSHNP
jgi:hypothetical protein